jgi:hypothetical protein
LLLVCGDCQPIAGQHDYRISSKIYICKNVISQGLYLTITVSWANENSEPPANDEKQNDRSKQQLTMMVQHVCKTLFTDSGDPLNAFHP